MPLTGEQIDALNALMAEIEDPLASVTYDEDIKRAVDAAGEDHTVDLPRVIARLAADRDQARAQYMEARHVLSGLLAQSSRIAENCWYTLKPSAETDALLAHAREVVG